MTLKSLKPLLAGATVATMLAFVAACSGTSSSMNPTAPTAAANSAAAGANFSPNPTPPPVCVPPQILNDAGDTCIDPPPPPPEGIPCSPGYWKNHQETWVGIYCTDVSTPSCGTLLTALTCKGSTESCGRHEAAAFLNELTGCTESD